MSGPIEIRPDVGFKWAQKPLVRASGFQVWLKNSFRAGCLFRVWPWKKIAVLLLILGASARGMFRASRTDRASPHHSTPASAGEKGAGRVAGGKGGEAGMGDGVAGWAPTPRANPSPPLAHQCWVLREGKGRAFNVPPRFVITTAASIFALFALLLLFILTVITNSQNQ